MKLSSLVVVFPLVLGALPAFGQQGGIPPPGAGMMPPPGMDMAPPTPPPLTKQDVEKLVVAIPEIAKAGGELSSATSMGPDGPAQPSPEDAKKIEAMLAKYGFSFSDFFVKMTVLMSTYMALRPDEFDRQMPSEKSPEVQKMLADPTISDADKAAVKKQIADIQANKEALRMQLTNLATDENKAIVKPMLAKVQKALEVAEGVSKQARAKMLENMSKSKAKGGPRRSPTP
jgi:hypothetical protein